MIGYTDPNTGEIKLFSASGFIAGTGPEKVIAPSDGIRFMGMPRTGRSSSASRGTFFPGKLAVISPNGSSIQSFSADRYSIPGTHFNPRRSRTRWAWSRRSATAAAEMISTCSVSPAARGVRGLPRVLKEVLLRVDRSRDGREVRGGSLLRDGLHWPFLQGGQQGIRHLRDERPRRRLSDPGERRDQHRARHRGRQRHRESAQRR